MEGLPGLSDAAALRARERGGGSSRQGVPELSWPSGGSLFNAFLKYCSKISSLPKRAQAATCLVVVGHPGCGSEMLLCGCCCCKLISRSLPAERGVRSSFSERKAPLRWLHRRRG